MFSLFRKQRPIAINVFNTATRTKEVFVPLTRGVVRIYSCGPTVYDHIHIGNLRAYLLPDLLHRLFRYAGYSIKLTINVTDFGHLSDDGDAGEDKMMKGMKREGLAITLENMRSFAEPYIRSFQEDLRTFGNLPPTTLSRASDYVKHQIKLIETLVQKGYAYETSDGVYFDISKFPKYGILGNVDVSHLKAGARIEANPEKHHPADFALWKKGPLGWKSRWGQGFPGWHIECTAMAFATLGKQIDIHTGGEDLMYTHHNGEIAQAEALTHKEYVKYWLHNAFVTINDAKIAKSKGTGIRLSTLKEKGFTAADYRYWLLQSHYRTPTNFTYEALESARTALTRLKHMMYAELGEVKVGTVHDHYEERFVAALADDLDTPKAIAILWELVKDTSVAKEDKRATILVFDSLLGLGLSLDPHIGQAELGIHRDTDIPEHVHELVTARSAARSQKDWAEADRLRDEIASAGYRVTDTDEGVEITTLDIHR